MRTLRQISRALSLALSFQFLIASMPANAQDYFRASEEKSRFSLKGSEYISGQDFGDTLMRVNLLGEVGKPGVHMVPAQTNFSSLLSFAGGPTSDADIENITIKRALLKKRTDGQNYQVIDYNMEDFLKDPGKKDLALKPNDIIHVPQKTKYLSDNSIRLLTVASTVLGIIVSGIVINDKI